MRLRVRACLCAWVQHRCMDSHACVYDLDARARARAHRSLSCLFASASRSCMRIRLCVFMMRTCTPRKAYLCARVGACVRACVRAYVRACVRECVRG